MYTAFHLLQLHQVKVWAPMPWNAWARALPLRSSEARRGQTCIKHRDFSGENMGIRFWTSARMRIEK